MHVDFLVFSCISNVPNSSSQTPSKICRAETDGAINNMSSAYRNILTHVAHMGNITTDARQSHFIDLTVNTVWQTTKATKLLLSRTPANMLKN